MPRNKGKSEAEEQPSYVVDYLPPGARIAANPAGSCVTFGVPVDKGELPGWVAVLRFTAVDGAVVLAEFTVTYFHWEDPVPGARAEASAGSLQAIAAVQAFDRGEVWIATAADAFGPWVQEWAMRPPPVAPHGGITIRRLRGVRVASFYSATRRYLEERRWVPQSHWAEIATKRPGKPGRDERYYAQIAADYVACDGRAPIVELAAKRNLSTSTVRNAVHEARSRGYLTKSGQGRPGGQLTDKTRDILAKKENDK